MLGSSLNGTELTLDVFHTGYFPNGGSVHYRFYTEDVEGELGDVLDIIEGKSEIADNIIPNWATVVTWNNLTNYNQKVCMYTCVVYLCPCMPLPICTYVCVRACMCVCVCACACMCM